MIEKEIDRLAKTYWHEGSMQVFKADLRSLLELQKKVIINEIVDGFSIGMKYGDLREGNKEKFFENLIAYLKKTNN